MAKAFIFPGQGSQSVGMGKDLADRFSVARSVFDEVDEALGQKLSKIMWEGPADELTLTANTQPALMAHSIAVFRVLQSEADLEIEDAACVAGHSLGEYSALCAAGAFSLADTARLLRIRGEAMQAAVPVGEGAMAAVLGLSLEDVETVLAGLESDGVCEIANDNAPGQVVISGQKPAVEAAAEALKAKGAKRVLPLPVSAAFHSTLMAPAAERMAEALQQAEIKAPAIPVIANVTAGPTVDTDAIRDLLVRQVTGRVRWTESVARMRSEGVDQFIEIGTGKVLAGLVKRIASEADAISIGGPDDIEKYKSL
ncbi:ACP S-malonyltransferase [Aquisalinus flavus]|uniref:Malonyl CoA-acyl carrier protein transacylase n=1 Tax=Aquisalinus flavus TaxID=1526572 RepID=A0A8J2V572_9PROT|nr:ACP S-malonyltransferase [Aquisalinus flavus]MBD0427923.1 ACP S-malonyltransferase [Aquisalinus flavus]UNE47680.1 ACP S-malonyltransferase [Aquisalinus flavus]GGD04978.1 malonyl CoA-acyl carrier protein transacylase [Aquisalinus flavus]